MAGSLPARIAKSIQEDYIDGRKVKPDERLPSVRELKDRYMTTNTTICSALTILENQGLVKKVHGKGNFVTEPPEEKQRGVSTTVGLVVPSPTSSPNMVSQLSIGVERAARDYGFQMMMAASNEDYEEERRDVERMRDAGCQGIVMCPMIRLRHQLRKDYLNEEFQDFPIVLMDMAFPEQRRSQVVPDNFRAGYSVTEWLLQQEGHQRIAFVDWKVPEGELMSRSVRDRYRGYLSAFKMARVEPLPEDHWQVCYPGYGTDPLADTQKLLDQWVARKEGERPTAIVALNDNWAVEMINYLMAQGVKVPEEVRIAGFDNCPTLSHYRPSFPTTDPVFETIGETAVQLLMQHINGELEAPVYYMRPVNFLPRVDPTHWKERNACTQALSR